jgi:hypothetical protein
VFPYRIKVHHVQRLTAAAIVGYVRYELERTVIHFYCFRPQRALLGLWLTKSEGLLSPKETLRSASWEAAIGTERTLTPRPNRNYTKYCM